LRAFRDGRNTRSEKYFRIMNELPVFALFGIVFLVVLKPI
jgi:protoporphyrinogen IX oxidase